MVSGISFGQKMGCFDSATDVINKPQSQTRIVPAQDDVYAGSGKKKSHKAGKVIGGLLITAAAVAAGLAIGHNYKAFDAGKIADLTKSFKDKSWASWAKEPAKNVLKRLDTAGEYIVEKSKQVFDFAKGFIDKKAAKSVEA